ncbi:hypothetical protein ACNF49_37170 [Actinomadura sp. ATCC 39365]
MNEMTELERLRSEVPAPAADALAAQEGRFLAALAAEEDRPPAAPRVRRRARPLLAGLPAAAALAAALAAVLAVVAVLGPVVAGRDARLAAYANSAIDIELRGDEYVATIKDPFADHALYSEAFRAMGLDVALDLRPASPTGVGKVFRLGFAGTTGRDRIGGALRPEGCAPGGRAARSPSPSPRGSAARGRSTWAARPNLASCTRTTPTPPGRARPWRGTSRTAARSPRSWPRRAGGAWR